MTTETTMTLKFSQPVQLEELRALRAGYALAGFNVELHLADDRMSVELSEDTDDVLKLVEAVEFFANRGYAK